jgi:transcriptional regulator with XRE-family HTH domain
MARTKALPAEENEKARAFLSKIVREDFKGNESAAAKRIGISQSMLHEFLAGTRGAGQNVLRAIAIYAGVSVDVVLGLAAPTTPPLNRHGDWAHARAEAERMHPEIPTAFLDLVGQGHIPGETPASIDGALVAGLAREWMAAAARAELRRRTAT